MAYTFERFLPPVHFRAGSIALGGRLDESTTAHPRVAEPVRAEVRKERVALGILAMLATTLLFPISDVASKYLTHSLPPIEIAFLRYVVFIAFAAPMLTRGVRKVIVTQRLGLQIGRGVVGGVATGVAILAFSYLPVA